MTIKDRLKEERGRLGFNQPDFAALAGRTKKTMIDYEKGTTCPDANFLAAIAAVGADVQYIVTGKRAVSETIGSRISDQGKSSNKNISKEVAELILKCNDFVQEQCAQSGFDMPTEKRHMLAFGIAHETIKGFGFDFERARGFASMATRMSIDHQLELAKITQPKKDEGG